MDPFDYANGMRIAVDRCRVRIFPGLDPVFHELASRALLADEIDIRSADGRTCSVIVHEGKRVLLATAFRYELAGGLGPAAALIPEPARLFLGAGVELLCYDLAGPSRLWRDQAEYGIHGWEVIDSVVLMSAELELAAWDTSGQKLWTTFVEPPWSYSIEGERIRLDVMGEISQIGLRSGRHSE
jgi:hypothetical protein